MSVKHIVDIECPRCGCLIEVNEKGEIVRSFAKEKPKKKIDESADESKDELKDELMDKPADESKGFFEW